MKTHVEKILELIGIRPNNNLIIWGAGIRGKRVLESLQNIHRITNCSWKEILFCDTNKEKQGTDICGISCVAPESLDKMSDMVIIFSVAGSEENCKELQEKYSGKALVLGEAFVDLLDCIPVSRGYEEFYRLGHFFSLYPDLKEIDERREIIFNRKKEIRGIDLNESEQIEYLNQMTKLYDSLPAWKSCEEKGATELRFRYLNDSFSPGDSVALHCMLRILKPKQMVEVGSGWSSAVTLDTNEYCLNNQIRLTFIEPYPDVLHSLLKAQDHVDLIGHGLQEVPLDLFRQLGEGDVLFIDSTHVSKVGSDVNYLFFDILPVLQKGVYIHFHDIFYPFEYPEKWTKKGMVWNELYLLRAFLMNNPLYKIIFFQNMMEQRHPDMFMEKWPLKDLPIHGGSLWLKKI